MAAFVGAEQSVANATPTKIVDVADFDRWVIISDPGSTFRVAFTSGSVSTGALVQRLALGGYAATAQFTLPADEELWMYQGSGASQTVHFIVTTK